MCCRLFYYHFCFPLFWIVSCKNIFALCLTRCAVSSSSRWGPRYFFNPPSIQVIQEINDARRTALVYRIINFVTITMMRYLSGNEQHFQSRQSNRLIDNLQVIRWIPFFGFNAFTLVMPRHQLEPSPQIIGQHHDLKVSMVALEFLRRNGQNAFPLRFAHQVLYISYKRRSKNVPPGGRLIIVPL